MSWTAFWEPILPAVFATAQIVALCFGILMVLAGAFWLVVALLTIGDMVRSGQIGRWRR
jgi:uncharacterized membrane protein